MTIEKPGELLQDMVAAIERVITGKDGIKIDSPLFLLDRTTGEKREHDVCITITSGHHILIIALECRDRSRKVTVNEVEAFRIKCDDTGVNAGAIVSRKGFSSSALRKAKHYSIRCLTVMDAASFSWLLAPGLWYKTQKLIRINFKLFLEADLAESLEDFSLITRTGEEVPISRLIPATKEAFQQHAEELDLSGKGLLPIGLPSFGLFARDNANGVIYGIKFIGAGIEYEIEDRLVPFSLVSYASASENSNITDVAMAEVEIPGGRDHLMFVYNAEVGGEILLTRSGKKT